MSKKLIECKTCGAEISKNADICPKCGAKNKSLFKKPKFLFLFDIAYNCIINNNIYGLSYL